MKFRTSRIAAVGLILPFFSSLAQNRPLDADKARAILKEPNYFRFADHPPTTVCLSEGPLIDVEYVENMCGMARHSHHGLGSVQLLAGE